MWLCVHYTKSQVEIHTFEVPSMSMTLRAHSATLTSLSVSPNVSLEDMILLAFSIR